MVRNANARSSSAISLINLLSTSEIQHFLPAATMHQRRRVSTNTAFRGALAPLKYAAVSRLSRKGGCADLYSSSVLGFNVDLLDRRSLSDSDATQMGYSTSGTYAIYLLYQLSWLSLSLHKSLLALPEPL